MEPVPEHIDGCPCGSLGQQAVSLGERFAESLESGAPVQDPRTSAEQRNLINEAKGQGAASRIGTVRARIQG